MKSKKLLTVIIGGAIVFGLGFGSGVFYQKKHAATSTTANGMPPTMSGDGQSATGRQGGTPPSGTKGSGNGGPGGGVSGEIISKTDTSLTIKTSDGSTKTVYFSDSTTISKNTTGASSDLSVGTDIMVSGTTNSDNSVTGKTIMIQPAEVSQ
ncbi:MAG: hypothetical protein WC536_01140 [Patescibacteria group bacterium]